jgi:hypothetical protein
MSAHTFRSTTSNVDDLVVPLTLPGLHPVNPFGGNQQRRRG